MYFCLKVWTLNAIFVLLLQEMGFSKSQAEAAIKQYGTVQSALDNLLAGVGKYFVSCSCQIIYWTTVRFFFNVIHNKVRLSVWWKCINCVFFSCTLIYFLKYANCLGGIMVNMLGLSAVCCEFNLRSSQTKDYKIAICYLSNKYATSRSKICLQTDFIVNSKHLEKNRSRLHLVRT